MSNKILENLWQVGGEDLTAPGDAAIYLVRLGDEAALVDAGCGPGHEQLVKNISTCLPAHVNIIYLFLTHTAITTIPAVLKRLDGNTVAKS